MTDHDAELETVATELEAAGLLTVTTDAEGKVIYQLTRKARPWAVS